jgi:hypothetical protein
MTNRAASWVAICSALAASCGGAPYPVAARADAQGELAAATEIGAEDVPRAALHLEMARQQLRDADTLIEEGRHEQAQLLLVRAGADARVALELTRAVHLREEATRAQQRVEALRRETAQQPTLPSSGADAP